jgi:outer membrane protein
MPIDGRKRSLTLFASLLLSFSSGVEAGVLGSLCSKGLDTHPRIKSSILKMKSKDYLYDQGIDRYKPQLTITAEGGYEKYEYEYEVGDKWTSNHYYDYGITITQTIYNYQLLKQIDDYALQRRLAAVQTEDEKARLVTQISLTSIELIRLAQIREFARKKKDLYQKAYEQIVSKSNMKFASGVEVAQAKARLTKSVGEYARLDQMYRFTMNNLKFLTNLDKIPRSLTRKRFRASAVARYFRASELKKHMGRVDNNTKVRIYKMYSEIARNMISVRKAERYPTVGLRARYGDGDYGNRLERVNDTTVVLQVSAPIYQGGYVTDRVNEAQVLYYSSVQDLEDSRLESKVSLEKNWEQIQTGLKTLEALKSAEEAGKKYYEASVEAYKNGIQSLTDTYLANIDYYDSKAQRVNEEADLLSAIVNLYYAVGIAKPATLDRFEKRYLR